MRDAYVIAGKEEAEGMLIALTDWMIGKYVDHIPFHRQLEQFKRVGVHLPASTVNDWFKDVAGVKCR